MISIKAATLANIFMGETGEAMKQRVVNQRITMADKPHQERECADRQGNQIPCPPQV